MHCTIANYLPGVESDGLSGLAIAKRVAEEQCHSGVIFLLEKIEQLCNNSGGPLPPQLTKNRI